MFRASARPLLLACRRTPQTSHNHHAHHDHHTYHEHQDHQEHQGASALPMGQRQLDHQSGKYGREACKQDLRVIAWATGNDFEDLQLNMHNTAMRNMSTT